MAKANARSAALFTERNNAGRDLHTLDLHGLVGGGGSLPALHVTLT